MTAKHKPEVCGVCRYYRKLNELSGHCRRYPPTVTFNNIGTPTMNSPHFPVVSGIGWCGEHKEKP